MSAQNVPYEIGEILFSDSFGDTRWKQIGPEGGSVRSLAINPQSPDTIYAGTYGGGTFKTQGKYKTMPWLQLLLFGD